ncbi:pimeloyl-ACP methyl ester carboxylesterase [Duganella sp. SG902]|uniref:alpha/beta fold hydrolase n=1 Tax=Duganella sp. SG902 TaxID=2587016 RepID=UPI00159E268C|nr:alpha/beta hydrolase [Duganella sp. SG902]NVM77738.1 pimeloyl-ACP methyl ester carboxylesterase [Duganella sp. SG902]
MPDLDILNPAAQRGKRWRNAGLLSAATLAAAYLLVRVQSARTERAHPPAGSFVEVDGLRLHYLEQGEGPVLVLLHGNMVMADDFRRSGLLERLARTYRVIAFDRPGFGYSDRPRGVSWTPDAQATLLHQALGELGAAEYLVLGHSWGTLVALAMALQQPERVRGLVLLSGYYYPGPRLDVPVAAMPALPLVGGLMRNTVSPLLGRLMWPLTAKGMFSPCAVPNSFRREPPWMLLRPSQVRATAAEAALMIPGAAVLEGRYGELRMPVTIMAGENDRVMDPHGHSERLHKTLPDSELVLLPEMGHMLPHLAQEEIVDAVDQLAERAGLSVPARLDGAAPYHGDAAPAM